MQLSDIKPEKSAIQLSPIAALLPPLELRSCLLLAGQQQMPKFMP